MDDTSKFIKLEDLDSLRDGIGFHFTSASNVQSILNNGLRPKIGNNSKDGLGREAISKTFISYGLSGVLQLYNRLLNASFELPLGNIRDPEHRPFLPDVSSDRDTKKHLSFIEGFEFVRQYMENNVYFIADVPISKYEHELSEEDIKNINAQIPEYCLPGTDKKIVPEIQRLDKEAEELREQLHKGDPNSSDHAKIMSDLQSKITERAVLSVELRNQVFSV